MEFIHEPYIPEETIAAVATPPGEGGVAIVRISGKTAFEIAGRLFSGSIESYKSHTAHFGRILNAHGETIDEGLALVMRGKKSYTGEDTVELHCHGGSLITRHVLEAALCAGARAARPGEFTFRAFINGKLDLSQAEAVQELIGAKNEKALDAAKNQLEGRLTEKISSFQKKLGKVAAILEAWVDFPEEGLEFASNEEIISQLEEAQAQMKALVDTFHDGKMISEGISLALIGAPNAGKSSLMNALLDKDRAIVSDVPGTTRDVLEDFIRLNGLHIKLMDTAGLRSSEDAIEQEGMRRTHRAIDDADLILAVLDATQPLSAEMEQLLDRLPHSRIVVVWNKMDLHPALPLPTLSCRHAVMISARNKVGIDVLHETIDRVIWTHGPPSKEEVLITKLRHKQALLAAIDSLEKVCQGLRQNISPEFISMDMRNSLSELGKIIGTNVTEDILSAIFSTFCIGK